MNALIPAIYFVLSAFSVYAATQHPHDWIGTVRAVIACGFLALGISTLRRYWRHG